MRYNFLSQNGYKGMIICPNINANKFIKNLHTLLLKLLFYLLEKGTHQWSLFVKTENTNTNDNIGCYSLTSVKIVIAN